MGLQQSSLVPTSAHLLFMRQNGRCKTHFCSRLCNWGMSADVPQLQAAEKLSTFCFWLRARVSKWPNCVRWDGSLGLKKNWVGTWSQDEDWVDSGRALVAHAENDQSFWLESLANCHFAVCRGIETKCENLLWISGLTRRYFFPPLCFERQNKIAITGGSRVLLSTSEINLKVLKFDSSR